MDAPDLIKPNCLLPSSLEHQKVTSVYLRGLDNEAKQFFSPTATEMDEERMTTVRWPRRTLAMVSASSS
jgi:hypothetical protein